MNDLAAAVLILLSLSGCQSPAATVAMPATLLGHWECNTATSVTLSPAGLPIGATLDEGAPHPYRYRWYYHRKPCE